MPSLDNDKIRSEEPKIKLIRIKELLSFILEIDWKLLWTWIRYPANKNNKDLNKACIIIWYRQTKGKINKAKNIYEIWLRVENAIIDLRSVKEIALNKDHSKESKKPIKMKNENQ